MEPAHRDRIGCELIAQTLRAGHQVRLRLSGTSMIPALWPGAVALVQPLTGAAPGRGNVVLFLRQERLFAHRVVNRRGGRLITRGDALPQCDPPLDAAETLGVVTAIVRGDGVTHRLSEAYPIRHRLAAFAIRHSRLAHRLVLRIHRWKHLRGPAFRLTARGPVPLNEILLWHSGEAISACDLSPSLPVGMPFQPVVFPFPSGKEPGIRSVR